MCVCVSDFHTASVCVCICVSVCVCGFGLLLLVKADRSTIDGRGVYKAVRGRDMNRPFFWDDEVGPLLITFRKGGAYQF